MDGDALSIRHCLDDLARAEARPWAGPRGPGGLFLLQLRGLPESDLPVHPPPPGDAVPSCSAAVEMPLLFHSPTPEQAEELARQGFLMLDQGYVRPLKLTPAFLADLDARPLSTVPLRGGAGLYDPRG